MIIEELTLNEPEYYLEDEYFLYDFMEHEAIVKGNLPFGYSVIYENNIQRDVGSHPFRATILDENKKVVKVLKANIIIYDEDRSAERYFKMFIDTNYKEFYYSQVVYDKNSNGSVLDYKLNKDEIEMIVVPEEIKGTPITSIILSSEQAVHIKNLFISKNVQDIFCIDGFYTFSQLEKFPNPKVAITVDRIIVDMDNPNLKKVGDYILTKRNAFRYYFGDNPVMTLPESLAYLNLSLIDKPITTIESNYYLKSITYSKDKLFDIAITLKNIYLDKTQVKKCPIFSPFYKLENVTLPRHIDLIPVEAFKGCTKLTNITIPNDVLVIEKNAFDTCLFLKRVELNKKLISIGTSAFESCKSLESIDIPSSVKIIKENTFRDAISLKNLTLNDGLEKIESNAFKNCSSLETVILPKTLQKLDVTAFNSCKKLKSIYILSDNLVLYGDAFDLFKGIKGLTVYAKNEQIYNMIKVLRDDFRRKFEVVKI